MCMWGKGAADSQADMLEGWNSPSWCHNQHGMWHAHPKKEFRQTIRCNGKPTSDLFIKGRFGLWATNHTHTILSLWCISGTLWLTEPNPYSVNTSSTKHHSQSSPGWNDFIMGCLVWWKCFVACLFGDESQQPMCPQLKHKRKWTHREPVCRHSSHPFGVLGFILWFTCSKWTHNDEFSLLFIMLYASAYYLIGLLFFCMEKSPDVTIPFEIIMVFGYLIQNSSNILLQTFSNLIEYAGDLDLYIKCIYSCLLNLVYPLIAYAAMCLHADLYSFWIYQ